MKAPNMVLELQVRHVYGRDLVYPMNDVARRCAELVGRKTLLEVDIARLCALGFTVDWIAEKLPKAE